MITTVSKELLDFLKEFESFEVNLIYAPLKYQLLVMVLHTILIQRSVLQ